MNPLDLVQFAALFGTVRVVSARSFRALRRSFPHDDRLHKFGLRGIFWLNGILLRTLHQWAGVRFNFDAMMRSMLVQASLSIFWSVLALCAMLSRPGCDCDPSG